MSKISGLLPKFSLAGVKRFFSLSRFRTAPAEYAGDGIPSVKKEKLPFRQNKGLHRSLATVGGGVLMVLCGAYLGLWQDKQSVYYDIGMQAYQAAVGTGDDDSDTPALSPADQAKAVVLAQQAFAASVDAFKQRQHDSWLSRYLYPHADPHLAALAAFQEGKIFIRAQKPKEAVAALKLYLQMNPGGTSDPYTEDTLAVQYDLELLYQQNPQLQQAEGKGAGQPGNGPGDNPAPDQPRGQDDQPGHLTHTKM